MIGDETGTSNEGPTAMSAEGPSLFNDPPVALSCLEIFGGNGALDTVVAIPGLDAWVYSSPHESEKGGDVHYISACGSGNIARVLVADVAGHGAGVEALARTLRDAVRKNIETLDMRRLVRSLNESFGAVDAGGRFATAIVATYFAPTSQIILVNAGHPRPVLYDSSSGKWRTVSASDPDAATDRGPRNLPLGVIEGVEYEQFAIGFQPGDALMLVTDAVIESKDARGVMLGESGLTDLLNSLREEPQEQTVENVVRTLVERAGSHLFDDDISIVMLRRNTDGMRRLSLAEHSRVWLRRFGLVEEAPSMVTDEQLRRLSTK